MSVKLTSKEAVMGQVIPKQHPAVVLRSHFNAVRALLAVALVAIAALAATVIIVADDDSQTTTAATGAQVQQAVPLGTRFDGGPDEGSRGPQSYWESSNPRSSYQPAPDEGFKSRAGGPQMLPGAETSRAPGGPHTR
jgi:hypothetical protein